MGVSGIGVGRRPADGVLGRLGKAAVVPAGLHLAGENLALVHAHVGIGQQRGQVVGVAADRLAGEAPVKRQADLVDRLAIEEQRPQAARHHRPRRRAAAGRAHGQPAAMVDAAATPRVPG